MANHVEKHLGNSDTEDSRTNKKCLCFDGSLVDYTCGEIWWNLDDIQRPVVLKFSIFGPSDSPHPTTIFQS